jgi:hypothetical protein
MDGAKIEHRRTRVVQGQSSERERLFFNDVRVKNPVKQTSKPKRRSQRSNKSAKASRREVLNGDESAGAEEIDRLLLSSLRLWEVEREIMEERWDARRSTSKDKEV